ncbi:MAG: FtsX-like permease family protein [Thermodesulfobacteriota bacterium]
MPFEFFIGRRYLRARRKTAFVSLISLLSTAGVSVGVMVMVVVIAVMSGADSELKNRLLGVTSHAVILHHGGPFTDYRDPLETIREAPGVEAATPYIYTQVMLRSPKGIFGSVLRGVDPETAGRVIGTLDPTALQKLARSASDRSDAEPISDTPGTEGDASGPLIPGILLGKELSASLGVGEGDLVSVVLPRGSGGSIGRMPVIRRFQVMGIYESGLYEFDKAMAYITLSDAQKMLRVEDTISGIEVRVEDVYKARAIADEIVSMLGFPYWAQDWMQMNRNLFSALKLQKTVMFIILALIILVAAFNIASTLIMMVMEKTRDIAILKAMGATDRSIKKIFVYKGMVIGGVGTLFGLLAGFILCLLLREYHFIELPTDVYFFSTLPVSLRAPDVLVIAASTLLICFLATLYPSHKAAKYNPLEAFRYGG